MQVRMTRRVGWVGLLAAAALLTAAAPASAAPGDASAFGAKAGITLLGGTALAAGPFAAAAAAGPTTDTFAGVDKPGVLRTGVLSASASRDENTGAVSSTASATDADLGLLAGTTGGVTAQVVKAECAATQTGVTGTTTLTGLKSGSLGTVDGSPAPNTTADVKVLGVQVAKVVFNEQIANPDGSLTVNAVHVTLLGGVTGSLGSGDLVLSSATCGPAGLPIPMASGLGLWLGLGLLVLVAVPAAAVALRRRAVA
ncbi:choice-of-anchor P family protein [Actinosynnema sp. NPDC020468]|uniref:choice-of-anchor P family protein n=1 Tax=Actinosynnema sp. NPDC020468 TaxID=3154488 RepID=UPI0033CF39AB